MNNEKLIQLQQELIALYESQIMDLTMMSKIELGDDVIAEIRRIKEVIKEELSVKMNNEEFKPKKSLLDRYGPNSLSDEDRERVKKEIEIKDRLICHYLEKGYTQEQAETTAMRIMYIPGFGGPTFRD